ncbi:MAG TPA: DUF1565 domain-containing protein [Kofleriaceae bacterium]|nr:DUF1565 domain-containing protein [Kofleriaceae bacterium]
MTARRALVALAFAIGGCEHKPTKIEPLQVTAPSPAATRRLTAFVGMPVDSAVMPDESQRVEPALPAGLRDDNGRIVGTPRSEAAGRLYQLIGDKHSSVFYLEIIAAPGALDRFVSPTGSDDADGSANHPLHTIRRALAAAPAGTRVFLHAGSYREDISLIGVHGTATAPIEIRSYPGEPVVVEGARMEVAWQRSSDPGSAPDEWVSPPGSPVSDEELADYGVFTRSAEYTRLLTYSRLEDLRSPNQRWVHDGSSPGPNVVRGLPRAWTYFGPGLWQDPASGVIHLRLSHTNNHVDSLADYSGPTDPSGLELAVWKRSSTPLRIKESSFIQIHDLTVAGGGSRTAVVSDSQSIVLDHVDIRAAMLGLEINGCSNVSYIHGRIDGGIPTWTFRSDYKDNYKMQLPDGTIADNDLIRKTSRGLLGVGQDDRNIEIAYCELVNGHDVYMSGIDSSLHHCLIRNIQDDALVISHSTAIQNLRIYDNVFERVLTAISGAGRKPTGPRYLYRNIFDLRDRVPGTRPPGDDKDPDQEVMRFGHVFKDDFSAGPTFFYQDTILLGHPGEQIGLAFFKSLEADGTAVNPRWFVNNVVVVDQTSADRSLAFVPEASYRAARQPDGRPVLLSDGNLWVRVGAAATPLFRCADGSKRCTEHTWSSLDDVRATGFEAHSRLATSPTFARVASLSHTRVDDDLRPAPASGARGIAIDLGGLPDDATARARDAGALPSGSPPLYIGVDGELKY